MNDIIYKIKQIRESDYGCEERPDGYVPMVNVYLTGDDGDEVIEMEDALLYERNLDEGSEVMVGPDGSLYSPDEWHRHFDESVDDETDSGMSDIGLTNSPEVSLGESDKQGAWMENYLDAVDELEDM